MHKFWATARYAAVATAFVSAALATGTSAQAAAPQATHAVQAAHAVTAQAVVKKPTTRRITCAIKRNVWSNCLNDNAKVARGQRVFLALNSSTARHLVQFRVKDKLTGRVLASPVAKRAPNGRSFLYWTNTSARTVTIDIQARSTAVTAARATLRVV